MLVMLNLFQHPSFHSINLEIPKQVRNDRGVQNDRKHRDHNDNRISVENDTGEKYCVHF
jgi:hypothetical protein